MPAKSHHPLGWVILAIPSFSLTASGTRMGRGETFTFVVVVDLVEVVEEDAAVLLVDVDVAVVELVDVVVARRLVVLDLDVFCVSANTGRLV